MSARLAAFLAFALLLAGTPLHAQRESRPVPDVADVSVSQLPPEARATIELIHKGGPYPYARDGVTFANREGRLPRHKRGYYHEYTVKTPGERTRGARRIIAGKGGELYYTDDHYNHFRRIRE